MFSGHSGVKLGNTKEKNWGNSQICEKQITHSLIQRTKEEITREIRKYFGKNENEDTPYPIRAVSKALLSGKFIAISSVLKRKKDIKSKNYPATLR